MQQWEYIYIEHSNNAMHFINGQRIHEPYPNLADYLNQIGRDGWELVGVGTTASTYGDRLFFKRLKL